MVIQLDNCVDCLKVLFPTYDFLFLLDHSSGHDKQKEDALNAHNMSVKVGGKQKRLRDSKILEEDGYLGPYDHDKKLRVGDIQCFVFRESDDGPFYYTQRQRNENRLDVEDGTLSKDLSRTQLVNELERRNISSQGSKKRLQEICKSNNIPIKVQVPKIKEGWVDKPKGKLQILWERGWIDTNNVAMYTNDGKVDAYGIVNKTYSLHHLMSNCKDFIEEESMLQSMAEIMGVKIDRTPICHAELAGEGVEYSWGCAKNSYRRYPLCQKRGKETYMELVKKVLSRDNLTTERIRKFARRARSYICAYYQLHYDGDNNVDANVPEQVRIERLAKAYKTHRSVVDFSSGFITAVVNTTLVVV
jgi:hypothetical protein